MLNSFRLKLAAYFLLLSALPAAAALWGFTSVAGVSATRQVDARLEAGLRAALASYGERVDAAEKEAASLARSRPLQAALQRRDRGALAKLLRGKADVYVTAPGGFRLGAPPPLGVRRSVDVIAGASRIGTVVATVPLDARLVRTLRARAGLGRFDALALLEGGTVAVSSPQVSGSVSSAPGRIATARVGRTRYRVLVASALAGAPAYRLAVLSPQSSIDGAAARTRDRVLLGLLVCLVLVAAVAYLEGRTIVRTLRDLARAARGIAGGNLSERVPVRGRDEFAELGGAFNEMAAQLEARLAELEAERARLAGAHARFGETLAATHDVGQLLRVIAESAVEATGARGATLEAGGATVTHGDVSAGTERLELPLVAGREALGLLVLSSDGFGEEQRLDAASLAAHAVVALENARLHRTVERQALVDGLTGIANRRHCEQVLHAEVARADRLGTALALVLADLDDFKSVNDEHGHAAGDETLRAFAGVLAHTVRESDFVGRWGGEEFLLLLPGADADGAARLAERLRLALAARALLGRDGGVVRVTASFGVAQHRPGGDAETLFAAADRALYRAKREGKDRVERESAIRTS